jgi:hypothetical protein
VAWSRAQQRLAGSRYTVVFDTYQSTINQGLTGAARPAWNLQREPVSYTIFLAGQRRCGCRLWVDLGSRDNRPREEMTNFMVRVAGYSRIGNSCPSIWYKPPTYIRHDDCSPSSVPVCDTAVAEYKQRLELSQVTLGLLC